MIKKSVPEIDRLAALSKLAGPIKKNETYEPFVIPASSERYRILHNTTER